MQVIASLPFIVIAYIRVVNRSWQPAEIHRLSKNIAPASASQVPAQKKYTLSKIIENVPQIAGNHI